MKRRGFFKTMAGLVAAKAVVSEEKKETVQQVSPDFSPVEVRGFTALGTSSLSYVRFTAGKVVIYGVDAE